MSLTKLLISKGTLSEHRVRWFVYTGAVENGKRERIPWQSTMRGFWPGYDVVCSCGWESRTGGATRTSVEDALLDHRWSEQCAKEREQEAAQSQNPDGTDRSQEGGSL